MPAEVWMLPVGGRRVGSTPAIAHRVGGRRFFPFMNPPADRRVVNADVIGDLLLGASTLEVRAGDAGRVMSRIKM